MIGAVRGIAGKTGVGLIQPVGRQMQAVLLLQVLLPLKLLLFLQRQRASSPSAMKHAYAVLYEAGCISHAVYAGSLHPDDSRLPNTKRVHAVLYKAGCKLCAVCAAGPLCVDDFQVPASQST